MLKHKSLVVILVLLAAGILSYSTPRQQKKSSNIVKTLDIPSRFAGWRGKDVPLGIDERDQRYFFIGDTFAREFVNQYGETLQLIILDAGNFHNPKVCFGGSGFRPMDLEATPLSAAGREFKATTIFFEKPGQNALVIYWITINKERVDWNKQKLLQLWYSLFNKEKIGLMVRLDIPATPDTYKSAVKLAQEFIAGISPQIEPQQRDFIFGK